MILPSANLMVGLLIWLAKLLFQPNQPFVWWTKFAARNIHVFMALIRILVDGYSLL